MLQPLHRRLPFKRLPLRVVCHAEHHVRQPLLEGWVIVELLKQFHIIRHNTKDNGLESALHFEAGVLLVRVAHGVLKFLILGNHERYFSYLATDVIGISPFDIPEEVIKGCENTRKQALENTGFFPGAP